MKMKKTIAITVGDPAGIGPEIIQKALRSSSLPRNIHFRVIGLEAARAIRPAKLSSASATIAWAALEEAVSLWKSGAVQGIVTAPIHKENMASIGFSFPGHTEYFSYQCGVSDEKTVMAFYEKRFCVGLTTAHLPLADAIQNISTRRIVETGKILGTFLKKIGIKKPRIAMAGINPHAGENGLLGSEEKKIIFPASQKLRLAGWNVSDPLPPDIVFHLANQGKFDGVIAHYHDQGLIPFKLIAFDRGVNVTLGLPLVRTSPDHGTALDLAGKNKANPESMIEALRLAARLIS
ncbi:MAG: 4-hydroxythreonine-4-phosphate dehydrogenase PdxA [Verrucomicrobiota bacterium]